jgi:transposase-like protein
MPKDTNPSKPTARRHSSEEKAAAVRMVRTLRAVLSTDHGTVKRVATQLGYGTESVRFWVRQADVDEGHVAGVSTSESARMKALEQESREFKRANEILKREAGGARKKPWYRHQAESDVEFSGGLILLTTSQ